MKSKFLCFVILAFFATTQGVVASPWAEKETYGGKVAGKFGFGLKHTLFSWLQLWTEAENPEFESAWEGFFVGAGKTVTHTAAGIIQLVTFPIPVDFPDVGPGLHIYKTERTSGFGVEPGQEVDVDYTEAKPVKPSELKPPTEVQIDRSKLLQTPSSSTVPKVAS